MTLRKVVNLSLATAIILILVALGSASPASATKYAGKTKGGSSISFKLNGSKLKAIKTVVPTICIETTGTYGSRAGGEIFRPPKGQLGKKVKSKALQPAAMNQGIKATKSYTVEARRSGKRIKGKLRLSYSFLIPDLYGSKVFICSGSTSFSATPR